MFIIRDPEKTRSAQTRQDIALIAEAIAGNAKAYEQLLTTYHRAVYHLLLKIVHHTDIAEDLTMEAFAKAFRYLPSYVPQYAFSTWLFRIATNNAIDFLRRQKLQTQSLSETFNLGNEKSILPDVADQSLGPEEMYMRVQRLTAVQRAVGQLPVRYQRMVQLRYFDELSYEEVAAALELPMGTVKGHLFQARALLAELLVGSQSAW